MYFSSPPQKKHNQSTKKQVGACTFLKRTNAKHYSYLPDINNLPYILSNLYIYRARILCLWTKGQMEAYASRILVKESLIVRLTEGYALLVSL